MRRFTNFCAALTLGLVAGAVTVVVAGTGPAHACSCLALTDEEAFEIADAVFVGELVGTELATDPGPVYSSGDPERFYFDVDKVFKGKATDRQTILTARDGASCGLEIGGSGPFLVFAYRDRGDLQSNLCSGTRPLSMGDLPASFGPGRQPTLQPADEPDEVSGPSMLEAAMSVWVALLFPLSALFLSPAS
jgi:hypothetical protein